MTGPGPVDPPPGASRERTQLSWRRTALTATVVALLLVRVAGPTALGALAVPGWLVALAVARRRTRALAAAARSAGPVRPPVVVALGLAVASFVVFGTVLVVLP
jgi:uncharacterized membrane protein YidH (DUF202 family)